MAAQLSAITTFTPDVIATAELRVETPGEGFIDITADARQFIAEAGARDGALFLFLRHTSASLTIQENADPDVLRDLDLGACGIWRRAISAGCMTPRGRTTCRPMCATMLTGVSLQIPVLAGNWRSAPGRAST